MASGGEFDEAGNQKNLTGQKKLVKFTDFAEPQRPHWRPLSRLLGRPWTLLW